ncbi:hypothetical protein E2P81_ATG03811 [Venturia nashicola]|nr:hypothetical protein E2P81_ATG03811 [Venturia nashicola]
MELILAIKPGELWLIWRASFLQGLSIRDSGLQPRDGLGKTFEVVELDDTLSQKSCSVTHDMSHWRRCACVNHIQTDMLMIDLAAFASFASQCFCLQHRTAPFVPVVSMDSVGLAVPSMCAARMAVSDSNCVTGGCYPSHELTSTVQPRVNAITTKTLKSVREDRPHLRHATQLADQIDKRTKTEGQKSRSKTKNTWAENTKLKIRHQVRQSGQRRQYQQGIARAFATPRPSKNDSRGVNHSKSIIIKSKSSFFFNVQSSDKTINEKKEKFLLATLARALSEHHREG